MSCTSNRLAFTLRDLLIAFAVIAVLLAITVPFVQQAREASRMNECQRNLKLIGLAFLNHEDKYVHIPPISSSLDAMPDIPGDSTASAAGVSSGMSATAAAGYSWLVLIFPDLEEPAAWPAYQALATSSKKFEEPAFSPLNTVFAVANSPAPHFSSCSLSGLQCPRWPAETRPP